MKKKIRCDWVGKIIHLELCKTNKWYMHNKESVLDNETHKLLCYLKIQTDHLISARRPDLVIINKEKRTFRIVEFAFPADHRVKLKESENKDKYLDLAWELAKLWNMKVIVMQRVIGPLFTVTIWLITGLEDLWIRRGEETIQRQNY